MQFQTWLTKKQKTHPCTAAGYCNWSQYKTRPFFSALFLLQNKLTVLRRQMESNSRCFIMKAVILLGCSSSFKNSTPATSSVYHTHLHVGRKLTFVEQRRTFYKRLAFQLFNSRRNHYVLIGCRKSHISSQHLLSFPTYSISLTQSVSLSIVATLAAH